MNDFVDSVGAVLIGWPVLLGLPPLPLLVAIAWSWLLFELGALRGRGRQVRDDERIRAKVLRDAERAAASAVRERLPEQREPGE